MPRRARTLEIVGQDRLLRKLRKLPEVARAAGVGAVKEETHETAQDERRNAPKDTGALVEGIQEEYKRKGLEGRAVSTVRYSAAVEHGTEDTPAQPFAQPAAERARKRFPNTVVRHVNEQLAKVTK